MSKMNFVALPEEDDEVLVPRMAEVARSPVLVNFSVSVRAAETSTHLCWGKSRISSYSVSHLVDNGVLSV